MKSLVVKELREVGLWAGVGGLLLLAAMALFLMLAVTFGEPVQWHQSAGQLFGTYCNWMLIGAPAIAFAIALIQILPETMRDQWAFLIHRPLTVRQIWTAKVLAGLCWYLAATLIPFWVVTGWMSAPGHFPGPFDLRMSGPCLVSIFAGIVFYFGGQLFALLGRPWFGRKLLTLATAGLGIALTGQAGSAAVGLLIALAFIVPMAIASEGAFRCQDNYAGFTLAQRVMLGAILGVGTYIAIALCVGILNGIVSLIHPPKSAWKQPAIEAFALTKSNKLVLVDMANDSGARQNCFRVMDLNGNAIPVASLNSDNYTFAQSIGSGFLGQFGAPYTQNYNAYAVMSYADGQAEVFYNYLDRVFDLYSPTDFHLIGYIGADGAVTQDIQSAMKFPYGPAFLDGIYASYPSAVYSVRFFDYSEIHASINRLVTAIPGEPFLSTTIVVARGFGSEIATLSKNAISIYAVDGRLLGSESIDWSKQRSMMISVLVSDHAKQIYLIPNGGEVAYDAASGKAPLAGATISTRGNIVSVHLPQSPYIQEKPSAFWPAVVMPFGPITVLIASQAVNELQADQRVSSYDFADDASILLLSLLGSVISLAAMIPLARRYGASGKKLMPWAVGAILLSWTAVLIILAMRPLPALIVCPSCGKKRVVDSVACGHCGHAMDPPAMTGREIFEEFDNDREELAIAG